MITYLSRHGEQGIYSGQTRLFFSCVLLDTRLTISAIGGLRYFSISDKSPLRPRYGAVRVRFLRCRTCAIKSGGKSKWTHVMDDDGIM